MIEDQKSIQKKIGTLIEKMYPNSFPIEIDENGISQKSRFIRELMAPGNGLCVGWVKVYMKRPQWLRSIWELVSAIPYEKFEKMNVENIEDLFRNYRFSNGSQKMKLCENCCNEVISSAIMAWNYMGDKTNYPKWPICPIPKFDFEPRETVDIKNTLIDNKSFTLSTNKKNAESLVTYIKSKNKNIKELMFHIDTMIHHMCVHSENYGKIIYLVETEDFGIGYVDNLSVIKGKLSKDLYQEEDRDSIIDTIDVNVFEVK